MGHVIDLFYHSNFYIIQTITNYRWYCLKTVIAELDRKQSTCKLAAAMLV